MTKKHIVLIVFILLFALIAARGFMPDPINALLTGLVESVKAFGSYANRYSPWS